MNEATQQQLDLTRFVTLDEYASNRTGVFPGGKGAVVWFVRQHRDELKDRRAFAPGSGRRPPSVDERALDELVALHILDK